MKAVNVDDVLKILHKYGRYIFVTDEKKYTDMEYEIANLKALEQEPILDKIRAEIKGMTPTYHNPDWSLTDLVPISEVLDVVNKYMAESEDKE